MIKIIQSNRMSQIYILLLAVFLLLLSPVIKAQTGAQWKCGSDIMRQKKITELSQRKHTNDSIEKILYQLQTQQFQKKSGGGLPTPQQIYTIPVVVHIIHNNGPENISDAQVTSAIQHMNDAFRNIGIYDPSTGVDVEIEFCLAKQDENGNFSTGINRVVSSLTNMTMETEDLNLKNLIRWNPTKYMNIWIVGEINSISSGSGVAGYAYFPSSHGMPEDGIVNEANYFGVSTDNSKVAVHEVGHYLGLYHTFQGSCTNNDCFTDGDKVCDTPPDGSTAPVACGASINTCATDEDDISVNNPFRPMSNGGAGDQNDMFINYMDYGHLACYSAFTLGQKNRMVSSLTGIRNSLLQSPGCYLPCTNPITASFTTSSNVVTAGTSVSFTNTSLGATSTIWQVNGTTFSTSANASYTFNTQGTYIIKLIVNNSDPACIKESTTTVTVNCPVTASFTMSPSNNISPGDNVIFTNTSTGANSYQWYIDGIQQGSTTNFNYTFSSIGTFIVYLTSSNGICDTTFYQSVNVGICTTKEANNWYFGDSAGVDFNSTPPIAITNSAMDWATEGCSSISDVSGNLLFYTNGEKVWNSNHVVMPNGGGLMGHISAYQSALIVKRPGTTGKYYIFTVDAGENNYANGLRYSEVDMSLDGGLGDIINLTKNTLLLAPVGEQLVGTSDCNGNIWIVAISTFFTNPGEIYAYLITPSGVMNTPVVSTFPNASWLAGAAKFSPDGNKFALSGIMDFNKSTGVFSNHLAISIPNYFLYSCEFSPDGSKLYVGATKNSNGKICMLQLDLNAGSQTAINNSLTEVYEDDIYGAYSAMQIAPNGKIYVCKTYYDHLGVINFPNATGTLCNFVDYGIDLMGASGWSGLPNFVSSLFNTGQPSIVGPDSVCNNSDSTYYLKGCFSSVTWSVLGTAQITSSNDSAVTIHFNNAGQDTILVEANGPCGTKKDTLVITVKPIALELGADTLICQGNSILLNPGTSYTSYLWQDGSTNPTYTVTTAGQYKVTVTNNSGCSATDSILISLISPVTSIDLGPDITSCNGAVTLIDAGSGFPSYQWQDGSTDQTYTVYQSGKYWVTVSACGTSASDTIYVLWQTNSPVSIVQDGVLCSGQAVLLTSSPNNFLSYIWNDGTFDDTRLVQLPGNYWLIVTDANGCYGQDSIDVTMINCDSIECGTAYIPNSFTPGNEDLINDVFKPTIDCVHDYSFMIFNRWGEKLYETTSISEGWNGYYKGNVCEQGVYVYKISFKDNAKRNLQQYIGTVTLLE